MLRHSPRHHLNDKPFSYLRTIIVIAVIDCFFYTKLTLNHIFESQHRTDVSIFTSIKYLQILVFLINSHHSPFHICTKMYIDLIPKLQPQFAEFPNNTSYLILIFLYSFTCVGLTITSILHFPSFLNYSITHNHITTYQITSSKHYHSLDLHSLK